MATGAAVLEGIKPWIYVDLSTVGPRSFAVSSRLPPEGARLMHGDGGKSGAATRTAVMVGDGNYEASNYLDALG